MLFLMGVLALLLTTPNANADDKEKYKLFAEETRKEVWALKLPEFTNTAVPDKYKDESAVILAAHSRLEITKKTRFNVGAFLGGFHYIDREVNCRDLYRMLVQINDKAALKEYSEFDYKAEIRKKRLAVRRKLPASTGRTHHQTRRYRKRSKHRRIHDSHRR